MKHAKVTLCTLLIMLMVVPTLAMFAVSAETNTNNGGNQTGNDQTNPINDNGNQTNNDQRSQTGIGDSQTVEVTSDHNQTGQQNHEVAGISCKDGLTLDFNHTDNLNPANPTSAMQLNFTSLVEFADRNKNHLIDLGEQVAAINLNAIAASSIPVIRQITSDNGVSGYEMSDAVTSGNCSVNLVMDSFSANAIYLGQNISATSAKVTIDINNYTLAHAGDLLALQLQITNSGSGYQNLNEAASATEHTLQSANGNTTSYFSWDNSAKVDGHAQPVYSNISGTADSKFVTLVYVPGQSIAHDPWIGVNAQPKAASADQRSISTSSDSKSVDVRSDFSNQSSQSRDNFGLSTQDGLKIVFNCTSQINAASPDSAIEIDFQKLVEFNDVNGNHLLTPGEEVNSLDLTTLTSSLPTMLPVFSNDGVSGYELNGALTNGNATVVVTVDNFCANATVNGTALSPTTAKITITISGYTLANSSDLLALEVQMICNTHNSIGEVDGVLEKNLQTTTASGTTFFSWDNNCTVDGHTSHVDSSVANNGEDRVITLVYQPGTSSVIVHDPKIGINAQPQQVVTTTPTPSPTPAPTQAPTPTPSPAPTATPTPTLAPTPSPTPAPTATPSPTAEPTATPSPATAPTAAPTETPHPTQTAAPVETPSPAPTPKPTQAPTIAPTQAPTATPTPQLVITAPPMTPKPVITTVPTALPQTAQPTAPPANSNGANTLVYVAVGLVAVAAVVAAVLLLRKHK